jgi:hypothetical protein
MASRARTRSSRRRRRAGLAAAGAALVAEAAALGRLGYRSPTDVIVRCRDGHLFTTIWIPGVNLKALDLGIARVQRCPVGRHWTVVRPVRDADLSARERIRARARHDVRLP